MAYGNRDFELAVEFFSHDVKNKRQVMKGFEEIIEETEGISQMHEYAKKVRRTQKDVKEMAEEAERIIECDETSEIDIQKAVQDSLDTLQTTIEYEDSSVSVNWDAENYTVKLNPTVEKMLYNLFDNSIEHGSDDIEVEVTEVEECLEVNVYDGGNLEDWEEIFPDDAEGREDYPSTGSYLIDRVAENNDIEIFSSEDWSYTVKIPFNTC